MEYIASLFFFRYNFIYFFFSINGIMMGWDTSFTINDLRDITICFVYKNIKQIRVLILTDFNNLSSLKNLLRCIINLQQGNVSGSQRNSVTFSYTHKKTFFYDTRHNWTILQIKHINSISVRIFHLMYNVRFTSIYFIYI